ncbi:hypothetical protein ACWPL4_004734, partial [Escherichia coli]
YDNHQTHFLRLTGINLSEERYEITTPTTVRIKDVFRYSLTSPIFSSVSASCQSLTMSERIYSGQK